MPNTLTLQQLYVNYKAINHGVQDYFPTVGVQKVRHTKVSATECNFYRASASLGKTMMYSIHVASTYGNSINGFLWPWKLKRLRLRK